MQSTIFRSTQCVRDIATSDLPRDRLLSRGASALSNTELLAVLFGCDPERIRADVCAAGGLAGYMIRHDGALTLGRQARVRAALELARRVMGEELAGREALTSPRDSAAYLKARLAHLPYEVFACLFLDNRHRVLAFEEMFRGTLDGASVHPREVVRAALEHNAAAVILAHNHPSGVAEPSAADRNITHQLRDALQLVGVRVLDHLVVGVGEPTSMAARGLI
jgi:DNA repair protein RadC